MHHRPTAVLDANVLFPFQLRNFLLWLAVEELYTPLWSDEIIEECMRGLRRDARMTDAQCERLLAQMFTYFSDAWGTGYAGRADALPLPDAHDRHVVALAVHYEAEFIVTRNAKHFPAEILHPLGIDPVSPDRFAGVLWARDVDAVIRAAEQHRTSLRDALDPIDYLESLRSYAELSETVERLISAGFLELLLRPAAFSPT